MAIFRAEQWQHDVALRQPLTLQNAVLFLGGGLSLHLPPEGDRVHYLLEARLAADVCQERIAAEPLGALIPVAQCPAEPLQCLRKNPGLKWVLSPIDFVYRPSHLPFQGLWHKLKKSVITESMLTSLADCLQSYAVLPGRKLLFFLSDGFVLREERSDSLGHLMRTTDFAARAGIAIYPVCIERLTAGPYTLEVTAVDNSSKTTAKQRILFWVR